MRSQRSPIASTRPGRIRKSLGPHLSIFGTAAFRQLEFAEVGAFRGRCGAAGDASPP